MGWTGLFAGSIHMAQEVGQAELARTVGHLYLQYWKSEKCWGLLVMRREISCTR